MQIKWDRKKVFILLFMAYLGVSSFFSIKNLLSCYIHQERLNSEQGVSVTGDALEQGLAAEFYQKIKYVELNGEVRKILGQKQMNGVVKLNNGYLTIVSDNNDLDSELYKNIADNVNCISELKEYLALDNTKLLCVVAPGTVCKYDKQLPVGIEDYTDYQLDYYIDLLSENDIEFVDLREEMKNDGIDHYSLYYRTDHHWNIWGGLYASQKLIDKANQMLGDNVDTESLFERGKYKVEKYEKWHLGSRGQRTGRFFAQPDDFEIMYPEFETNIKRCSDGLTGEFKDVFINTKALNSTDYTMRYTYDTTYWNNITDTFENENATSNKNIFLFTDSMGRVVTPNLSLAYKNVKVSDMDFIDDDVKKRNLEEFAPDLFVILLYPENLSQEGYLDFGISGCY